MKEENYIETVGRLDSQAPTCFEAKEVPSDSTQGRQKPKANFQSMKIGTIGRKTYLGFTILFLLERHTSQTITFTAGSFTYY